MESILNSIKKLLGIDECFEDFDSDVIIHINSVLMVLNQLGVGPERPYSITGTDDTWQDFLGDDYADYNLVKTYVYSRVRLVFDPPTNAFLVDSITNLIREYEYRLELQSEADKRGSDEFWKRC